MEGMTELVDVLRDGKTEHPSPSDIEMVTCTLEEAICPR
jgi:hypothetical protein